jgi:hypothetical protein
MDNVQIREGKEKTDKTGQLVRGNRKIYKRWCVLGDWFVTFENEGTTIFRKIGSHSHRSRVTF